MRTSCQYPPPFNSSAFTEVHQSYLAPAHHGYGFGGMGSRYAADHDDGLNNEMSGLTDFNPPQSMMRGNNHDWPGAPNAHLDSFANYNSITPNPLQANIGDTHMGYGGFGGGMPNLNMAFFPPAPQPMLPPPEHAGAMSVSPETVKADTPAAGRQPEAESSTQESLSRPEEEDEKICRWSDG